MTDPSRPNVYDAERALQGWPGWVVKTVVPLLDGSHDVALTRNGRIMVLNMMYGRETNRWEIGKEDHERSGQSASV